MPKPPQASKVVSFTVPDGIKEILEVIPRLGYYDSLSEFLRDAIRAHLTSHRDLLVMVVYNLYKERRISITKAGVMLDLPLQETEQLMKKMEVC